MAPTIYRQGDVLIMRLESPPATARHRVRRDEGRVVLAYGEVTGHAHAIADRGAELFDVDEWEDRYLRVDDSARCLVDDERIEGVALRHEEHSTIVLPAGDYLVRRQREYSPEAIRQVAD